MSRLAGRRFVAASILAASIVALAACGSDQKVPSREGQEPVSSTAADGTPKAPSDPEADAPPVDEVEQVYADTPEGVAAAFTQTALGNKDSLNSLDMWSAVQQNSAYLTEEMQHKLIDTINSTDDEVARRVAWSTLPYNVPYYYDGAQVESAVVTPLYSTVMDEGANFVQVEAITEYVWRFADPSIPAAEYTATYLVTVIPGDDPEGPPYLIAGIDRVEHKPKN